MTGGMAFWAWSLGTGPAPFAAEQAGGMAARPVPEKAWGALKVMTANVRMSSSADGNNDWVHRRELVVKIFLKHQPDLLLCQEVTPAQGAYLNRELTRWYGYYPRAGVGKSENRSGGARGELMGVLNQSLASLNSLYYRNDRFDIVDGEAGLIFPDELQAVPAENAYFTLAVLKEKVNAGAEGGTFIVVDTHLRHGEIFAARCAARVRQRAGEWLKQYPGAAMIIGGDMNHDRTSPVYASLMGVGKDGGPGPTLADAFNYAAKPAEEGWGSWHPYNGIVNRAWPSDLIVFSDENLDLTKNGAARILREQGADGRWPSDHFFVLAELQRVR